MGTYSNRNTELVTIERCDDSGVWFSNGWGSGPGKEVTDHLSVGKTVAIETKGNRITGWLIDGSWVAHKSDEDLQEELQKFLDEMDTRRSKELNDNYESWKARTDALPDWIRVRLDHFWEAAGSKFELEGWGYELAIAEMAVLFFDANLEESDELKQSDAYNNASGNQVDLAKALARVHKLHPEETLSGTVSGMSIVTGSQDYR